MHKNKVSREKHVGSSLGCSNGFVFISRTLRRVFYNVSVVKHQSQNFIRVKMSKSCIFPTILSNIHPKFSTPGKLSEISTKSLDVLKKP